MTIQCFPPPFLPVGSLMQMYVWNSLEFISPFLNRPHRYYGSLAFVAQNRSGFYKNILCAKKQKPDVFNSDIYIISSSYYQGNL